MQLDDLITQRIDVSDRYADTLDVDALIEDAQKVGWTVDELVDSIAEEVKARAKG